MRWHERMVSKTEAKGWDLARLARESGVSVKLIYKYADGVVANPRGDTLLKIAAALGVTEPYLRYGENIERAIDLKRIPLLSMNEIGTLKRGQSALEAWDGVSLVSAPITVSEKAFGVQLIDEACGPEFHAGNVVIVEPELALEPGRYVVAVVEGEDGIKHGVFRRYRPSGLRADQGFQLMATNPDFPTVVVDNQHPGFVVGRATKHIRDI